MLPLELLYYTVYFAAIVWILVFLYHAFDNYTVTHSFRMNSEIVSRTNTTFKNMLGKKKETLVDIPTVGVEPQPYEVKIEAPPAPVATYVAPTYEPPKESLVVLDGENAIQPNFSTGSEKTNFSDALLEMALTDSMREQHEKYVEEADFGSNAPLYAIEVEPVDVVPWVGLRRVNYAAVDVSDAARAIPTTYDLNELPKSVDLEW